MDACGAPLVTAGTGVRLPLAFVGSLRGQFCCTGYPHKTKELIAPRAALHYNPAVTRQAERRGRGMAEVRFKSQDGLLLEGRLDRPAKAAGRLPAVVIAHPHPLFGGSQESPVVRAIASGIARAGIAALRFNFRGVGESERHFLPGEGVRDVEAAVDFLSQHSEIDPCRIAVAGYSFGAWVGLRHFAGNPVLVGFAALGMPVGDGNAAALLGDRRPKLFITGSEDRISPAHLLRCLTERGTSIELVVVKSADHAYGLPAQRDVVERIAAFCVRLLDVGQRDP